MRIYVYNHEQYIYPSLIYTRFTRIFSNLIYPVSSYLTNCLDFPFRVKVITARLVQYLSKSSLFSLYLVAKREYLFK